MVALSQIRSDLALVTRAGTLSTDLKNLYTFAVNTAIKRKVNDGYSGLTTRTMVAETWGELSVASVVVTSVGDTTATITTTSGLNVFAGDIIKLPSGKKWLIFERDSDTVIDLGAPQLVTESGAGTIYRRGIKLPYNAKVTGCGWLGTGDDTGISMEEDLGAIDNLGIDFGDASKYHVHYDEFENTNILSVIPGGDKARRIIVSLTRVPAALSGDSDDLDWPQNAVDDIIEQSRDLILTWTKESNPVVMAAAQRAAKDSAAGSRRQVSGPGSLSW